MENGTTVQATQIQKRRTVLLKRVQMFYASQLVFMPGLHKHLNSCSSADESDSSSKPEHMHLHLPSSIDSVHRGDVCGASLSEMEDKLRYAQAMEALSGLRRQLQTRVMASKLNNKHASSQRIYVRSRALQDQVEVQVRTCQRQYNTARAAVLALRGPGDWEKTLAVLKPEDVRGISEHALTEEDKEDHLRTRRMAGLTDDQDLGRLLNSPVARINPRQQLTEGRRTLSWIWYSYTEEELKGKEMDASEPDVVP